MKRSGFTLIEMLVVVAIIVILISILLPALGHIKAQTYKTSTTALMSQLEGAMGQYYTTFNAYPGPASVDQVAGSNKVMSGAQNMLLGLSYALVPASAGGAPSPLPPGSFNLTNVSSMAAGPINYAVTNPLNPTQGQQLSAFFTVTPKNTAIIPSAVPGANNKLPVVIDTFTDALPILCYRKTPGVDMAPPAGQAPPTYSAGNNKPNPYFFAENAEYTSSNVTLTSPSGASFQQPASIGLTQSGYVDALAANGATTTNGTPVHGGYILVSAGIDRIYGSPDGVKPADDIVIVGGD